MIIRIPRSSGSLTRTFILEAIGIEDQLAKITILKRKRVLLVRRVPDRRTLPIVTKPPWGVVKTKRIISQCSATEAHRG